jgi:uncharacterized membrane protein (UPF0127 family)
MGVTLHKTLRRISRGAGAAVALVGFSLVTMTALFAERPDPWGGGDKRAAEPKGPAPSPAEPAGALIKPIDEVWRIVFHNARGQDVVLDCEVARSVKDQERGLMFRKFLGKNRGMIFVYGKPHEMNFWMQNTHVPLSIAFIHEKLFVSSMHDMKPLSLDIIGSEIPVLYAIEVNQGWFKTNSILSGNRLTIYKNPADYKPATPQKNKYRKEVPQP